MPFQFRCSACNSLIHVGDDLAGRKVRCGKCQVVLQAPALSGPATAIVEPTWVEPIPEPPAAPPTAITDRPREAGPVVLPSERAFDGMSRPRNVQADDPHDAPSTVPVGLIAGLSMGGLALAGLAAVALAWLLHDEAPEPPMAVEHIEARKLDREPDWARVDEKKALRDRDPFRDRVDKDEPFRDAPPFKDDRFKDREPKDDLVKDGKPPGLVEPIEKVEKHDPPVRADLSKGAFTTEVVFNPKAADGINITRVYEVDSKPNAVYLVRITGAPGHSLRISGPGGPIDKKDYFDSGAILRAFLAEGGVYKVTVVADRFDTKPCQLQIRALDGTEPLPVGLRVPSGAAAALLPDLGRVKELNVYEKQFSAAAFSFDSKFFLMAHGDQTISYWELPGVVQKGAFHSKDRLSGMAVDSRGRLYAQLSSGDGGPLSLSKPHVGDLHVWDNARPSGLRIALPPPTRTLPIGGIVQRLVSSPDSRWLFYLDTHNRRLGRIDVNGPALDKTLDALTVGASAMALTPDGRKIYVASLANKIDVVDAAEFKLERTVALDRGKPTDIAVTNEGLVYLVGDRADDPRLHSGTSAMAADLRGGAPSVKVIPLNVGHHCRFVQMLPDQRAVLYSGDRKITVCSIPDRPALVHTETREHGVRDYFMPGVIVLSRDGRTLLQDTAVILSVSR